MQSPLLDLCSTRYAVLSAPGGKAPMKQSQLRTAWSINPLINGRRSLAAVHRSAYQEKK
jgi:hypothetical protein